MAYVNPKWLKSWVEKLANEEVPAFVICEHNVATKALIASLEQKEIKYSKINLGAGVYKITNQTNICPKCGGSGCV